MPRTRRGGDTVIALLLIATVVVWGSAFTGIKVLVAYLDPIDVAILRFAVAAAPLLVLWTVNRRRWRPTEPMDAKGAVRLMVLGALAGPAYHLPLNVGEARIAATASVDVAASVSALLVSTVPIFTFALAVPTLGERVTVRRLAGLVVALAGVTVLVIWGRGVRMEADAIEGALLVLLAPISWAVYSILIKKELARRGALALTTYSLLAGTLLLVPLTSPTLARDLSTLPAEGWFWILWLGLAATFGGYVVWNYALVRWDATRVSTFVYLAPLAAVAWAVAVVDERITAQLLIGGALILAGVWLASSRRRATTASTPGAEHQEES